MGLSIQVALHTGSRWNVEETRERRGCLRINKSEGVERNTVDERDLVLILFRCCECSDVGLSSNTHVCSLREAAFVR